MKRLYFGLVLILVVCIVTGIFAFMPRMSVRASNDILSIDISDIRINQTIKPPEQPSRNQSQAITVTTLGTNQDKLGTSPWTALTGKSLTAGDYVFVTEAADSATSGVKAFIEDAYKTGQDATEIIWGANYYSQSFNAGGSYTSTSVNVYVQKNGSPITNLFVDIYAADANHKPTGSSLSNGSIGYNAVTSLGWYSITVSSFSITANTEYCIVLHAEYTANSSNCYSWGNDSTSPSYNGYSTSSSNSGSSWATAVSTKAYLFGMGNGLSVSLTADVTGNNAGNVVCKIWSGKITTTSSTYDIVITNTSTAKAMTAIKASGLVGTSALDASNNATGTGTDASTGATGTLSQADELIIGVSGVEDEVDDAHGTWSGITGNEQFAATNDGGDTSNIQCHSVAMVVSANTTKTGTDAGHDSNDWAGAVATYKMDSGATYDFTLDVNSKAFGVVATSTTYWSKGSAPSNPIQDGECTFILTSTGSAATDIDAHIHNFTGGVGWTIGAPGQNQARLSIGVSGTDPATALVLTTADQELKDNLAAGGHFHFDIKMETPTSVTDGVEKSTTITLTGRAHS